MYARPRRNRRTKSIRSLVREHSLSIKDLIHPFFVVEGEKKKEPIASLPGICHLSFDTLLKEAELLHRKGVEAIALFPVIQPQEKDPAGSYALREDGLIPRLARLLKKEMPSLCLIADIALDPFTSHGHDGLVDFATHKILNDETVDVLVKMAAVYAASGIDYVAPSDMMDGRVLAIRKELDAKGFTDVGILSYAAKYASSLYAPFREALGSTLSFGDKKTYQMDPGNRREAVWEAVLDEEEGADILLVKPATLYLDVISEIRKHSLLPLCAYHVSGEYAMVMAAAEKGFLDAPSVFLEALLGIKRAGADMIMTYATSLVLPHLES